MSVTAYGKLNNWSSSGKPVLTYRLVTSGPLLTEQYDVLQPNLVKSRRREIGCYNDRIAIQFYRHFGSAAAELPVTFQRDWKSF